MTNKQSPSTMLKHLSTITMKIQHILLATTFALLTACSSSTADSYIEAINEATERINKADNFDEIKAATKELIDFEREHRDAINEEVNGNKLKQIEVDNAYKEFMKAGMERSLELGKESAN